MVRTGGCILLACAVMSIALFGAFYTAHAAPPPRVDAILASSAADDVIAAKLSRFAPAQVWVEPGMVKPKDLKLIGKLVEAADHLDRVFWEQVNEEGWGIFDALVKEGSKRAALLATLMSIHYGPWDRLSNNDAFVGTRHKPAGAAFYPPDLSRVELDRFVEANPDKVGELLSPYTVVRRKGEGLVVIPYSVRYRKHLTAAASALREAAASSRWSSLKEFLLARAEAFGTDDYYGSEIKWMETEDCPFIVVLGPYEFYEDLLTGSKTAYEAIIAIRDDDRTALFKGLSEKAPEILSALPWKATLKEKLIATQLKPITVAHELYAAGDTRAGAQTTAFTLPNDPRVRAKKGTRQVILHNVARAKFNHSWLPLSSRVVADDQNVEITFDSYFDQLIAVELARSVSPAKAETVEGRQLSAKDRLKQRYHPIEEAKSDALGLFTAFYFQEKGFFKGRTKLSSAATYLASVFRVVRFDLGGAHGLAKSIVFNYLSAKGGFKYDPTTRKYRVVLQRLEPAVVELVGELLDIMVRADYAKAGRFIMEYGLLSDDVRKKLLELDDVPVDILPEYPIKTLLRQNR